MTIEKQLCSFCDKKATRIDKDNFIIACSNHKGIAQRETENFFKEYPDYTRWKIDVPTNRLKFK